MSLPWFAFNIKAYLSDTMRLTTEAHGAYLLLMLDYYETGQAPPDDDFILAAIAKLQPEQWVKHRKVLERFFKIEAGHWKHERIEREMLAACDKHARSIAQARTAADARWGKEGTRTAQSKKRRQPDTEVSSQHPVGNAPSMPEQSSENAHLHKHPPITGGGEPPAPDDDEVSVGTPIPRDFLPSPEISDRAKAAGITVEDIDIEVRKFIGMHLDKGSFSRDWQGSFAVWIEREIAHRKKQAPKAPPRIEVNSGPTEKDYDRALAMFVKNNSHWSRQLGPEPGMIGCKAPKHLIEKHGLDPATGLRKAS